MLNDILIVDPQEAERLELARLLEDGGFRVTAVASGAQALELAASKAPSLAVLALDLGDLSGFELCQRLKSQLDTSLIPVIFLTTAAEAEHKAEGLEMGAADFISKPFDAREVLARIRAQLQVGHLNSTLQQLNEDLLRLSNDLMDKQRALEEDLEAAAKIQHTLVPRGELVLKGLRSGWCFVPCESVGGDIFNALRLDETHVALYIIDVTGHGVPSAMVTFSVAQSLAPHVGMTVLLGEQGGIASPREVLERLDEEYPLERFDKPFTIFYLVLDISSGELQYSAAAHPPAVLVRAQGGIEWLDKGGPVIGMGEFLGFEEGSAQLASGDRLFIFTDGITEQCDASGALFGDERLLELLSRSREMSVQEICDCVVRAVREFSGTGAPRDDLSLFGVEFVGATAPGGGHA